MFGRPLLEALRMKRETRPAIFICDRTLVNVEVWYAKRDFGSGGGSSNVGIALDFAGGGEIKGFVVDEGVGDFDDGDVAREATVVPPVALDGRDVVEGAGVVYGDHDEVS